MSVLRVGDYYVHYDVFGSLLHGCAEGRTLSAIARDAISFEEAGKHPDDMNKTISEMTPEFALNILKVGLYTFDIADTDWMSRDGFLVDYTCLAIDAAYNLVDHVTVSVPSPVHLKPSGFGSPSFQF